LPVSDELDDWEVSSVADTGAGVDADAVSTTFRSGGFGAAGGGGGGFFNKRASSTTVLIVAEVVADEEVGVPTVAVGVVVGFKAGFAGLGGASLEREGDAVDGGDINVEAGPAGS